MIDDFKLLQNALDALYEWSNRWQLSISCKKCSAMIIDMQRQSEEAINATPLSIGPNCIAASSKIKDLAITTDSKLRFSSRDVLKLQPSRSFGRVWGLTDSARLAAESGQLGNKPN